MKLTVQIVNYNSRRYLGECLASLHSFLEKNDNVAEIIVINNDTDPIGHIINGLPQFTQSRTKIIEINENIGFGRAHNRGAKEARGELLLLLNPDAKIIEGSLEKMLNILENNNDIGVIGPFLIDGKGQLQADSWGLKKTPLSTVKAKLFEGASRSKKEGFFEVDWVSGGAMMIRKKTFSSLGGFDESYFMYYEDVDFCFQAKKIGWKIIVDPAARVCHQGGKSFSSHREKKRHYYASQNHYLKKNFGFWQAGLVKTLRLPIYIKNVYLKK